MEHFFICWRSPAWDICTRFWSLTKMNAENSCKATPLHHDGAVEPWKRDIWWLSVPSLSMAHSPVFTTTMIIYPFICRQGTGGHQTALFHARALDLGWRFGRIIIHWICLPRRNGFECTIVVVAQVAGYRYAWFARYNGVEGRCQCL